MYVHDGIRHLISRRRDLESNEVECMWVELKTSPIGAPSLVGIVYRNPASLFQWYDAFVQMMDLITEKHPKSDLFILGDFNINLMKPHSAWESTYSLFGLKQLVTAPTRITHTTSTLLDHIYTNKPSRLSSVQVSEACLSDHYPIICSLVYKPIKNIKNGHTTIEYRSFKRFNVDYFLHDLSLAKFENVYQTSDPEHVFSIFYEIFIPVINKHAPLRRKRVQHQTLPGWLSGEIVEAMKARDKAKKQKNYKLFKTLRNRVSTLVRDAKKKHFSKLINNNNDTTSLWRAMNAITHKNSKSQSCALIPHSADSFNNFFISMANLSKSKDGKQHLPSCPLFHLETHCKTRLKPSDSCSVPPLAVHEVGRYITTLPNKRSMGPDNLNAFLLKISLPYIVEPLTFAYNLCIQRNFFPKHFKQAKIIPLEKVRGNTELNNFRPISLLSVLSKPLEKHIHIHITEHIERNNLFHSYQSGFRKNHSCHTALVRLCDSWLTAINKSEIAAAVFLDFRKAFDLVSHEILIKKLNLYLNNYSTIKFIMSFLDTRTQRVYVNGNYSSIGTVYCGVPQGSILGPLLFCLYINDLPLYIKNNNVSCDLFADDGTLHTCSADLSAIQHDLQDSLNDVKEWCIYNKMVINAEKTKCMLFTTRQKRQKAPLFVKIQLEGDQVEQVDSHRLLGVTLDEDFTWKLHISNVNRLVAKNLHLLKKLKLYVDRNALKSFFTAHCLSHINYASTLWSYAPQAHLKRLLSLHKRAIKLINSQNIQVALQPFNTLDILSLHNQFLYNTAILTFKVRHSLAPSYLQDLLNEAPNRYNSMNYILPRTRVDLYKTSFSFSGPSVWNSLPLNVKSSNTLSIFKPLLKQHLSLLV